MKGGSNFSAMTPPIFDGDNYQMWVVRMETYLEALDLWETKAAVSPVVFTRIMSLKSAKKNLGLPKVEYEGEERICGIQVLNLIREFEL